MSRILTKPRYRHRPPMVIPKRNSTKSGGPIAQWVGKRLQEIRHEKGLRQKDVAALIGLHVSRLSNIENGYNAPSVETLGRVLRALGETTFVIELAVADE